MQYRIKLLPPDIDSAVQKDFVRDLSATNMEPDGAINAFHTAAGKFFPDHTVLGVSSGTAALHLALQVSGVKENDDVLCPGFTFAATVNAILYLKAQPVFIDSEKDTWNMDPALLEAAILEGIKKGRKPAAVLLVHSYGTPAKVEAIQEIAERYKIPLVEDAAPAFGAYYNGKMAGTFGDCGAFSFNYNKIITTAGGGLLISKNEELIQRANYLANQARAQAPFYLHHSMGYNYRISGLAATLGTVQLPRLQQKLLRKKQIHSKYREELDGYRGIKFQDLPEAVQPNYWLTSFLLEGEYAKEKVFQGLRNAGIECRMLWNPMHLQPAFRHFSSFLNGVSEGLFKAGISLPCSVSLKDHEQEEVISCLKSVL